MLMEFYKFQYVKEKGALLYTVRCSALDALLGSPFGRAGGEAD